jgi:tetratricopeptide (TPR) repeat protein
VAWHLFFQRRYDEAISHLQETLRMDSGYAPAHTLLARALAEQGRFQEAFDHLRAAAGSMPAATNLAFVAYVQALSGDRGSAEATLQEVRKRVSREYVPPYYLALVYAAESKTPEAVAELERAYKEQDPTLVSLKIDPRFDTIRSHPGYTALMSRMRFP